MLHKSFDAIEVKADGETGTFEATVAVFGNVDSVGDRIIPGAFSKTLNKWRASNDPVPVILSHQAENPMAHVGFAMPRDIVETPKGLLVKGTLDIGDNEVARQVHKLMKRRSLKEFSFGYKVPRGGEKRAPDGANELREIDLIEVGPTLKGANPATELHAVKSALAAKADEQTEETEGDTLETVLELIQDFLETEDDPPDVAAARDIFRRVQALLAAEQAETPDGETDDTAKSLRRQSDRLARDIQARLLVTGPEPRVEEAKAALLALEAFDVDEAAGVHTQVLKAAWTAAYVNSLPDSSFLYIAPGGDKDSDGKTTPRSLRYFPYADANGTVDLPHLRNALSRLPQSNLSPAIKQQLTAKAERLLNSNKSAAVTPDKEPLEARSEDPLRKRSLEAVLEIQSDGMSRRKSPPVAEPPASEQPSEAELRRRSRDVMLAILTGTEQ